MMGDKRASFREMARIARERKAKGPRYEDSPESIAERKALAPALREMVARATRPDDPDNHATP